MVSPKKLLDIKMFYSNMKVKVCTLDGDADFFDIAAGVL